MFKKYFSKKKLVCFDFDGLLVDSEPIHHQAYSELMESLSFPLPFDFEVYCKIAHSKNRNLFPETVKEIYPEFSIPWKTIREQKTDIYRDFLSKGLITPMEGAEELIKRLHEQGIKTCIVTNSNRWDVEEIAKTLPFIHDIPLHITREDYDLPKPAPDGYIKALQHYNVLPEDAIGLDDAEKGIHALKIAGIQSLLINMNADITSLSAFNV